MGKERSERRAAPQAPQGYVRSVEWPTVVLGGVIYVAWLAATAWHDIVPWWLLPLVGGSICAWHGSLQHEATHRHPTRSAKVNALFAGWPLSLWLPFRIYRSTHLAHHRTAELTQPGADPESFFVRREDWAQMSRLERAVRSATFTLVGRLALGPALVVLEFLRGELHRFGRGDRSRVAAWGWHVLSLIPLLAWLTLVELPLWKYVLGFAYPGLSITLIRSFYEHRPALSPAHRTAIVESRGPLAWLFLFNNLHALHHAEPSRPWYELPARYRARKQALLEANGGFLVQGYRSLWGRFGWSPQPGPVHPLRARDPDESGVRPVLPRRLTPVRRTRAS